MTNVMETGHCYFRIGIELWLATSIQDIYGVVTTVTELIDPVFFVDQ